MAIASSRKSAGASRPLLESIVVERNGPGDHQFTWNSKHCTGNELHLATLKGDLEEVKRILKTSEELSKSRFTFMTVRTGGQVTMPTSKCISGLLHSVHGSGQAIHLAASRGHLEILKELLAAKASLTDAITHDHKEHYDVLFAALLGGHEDA